ncbi:MAG TPA: transposase [Bryobacteraceae bacterium]|nr:transposase [Bryobacteraceae bacterium]
MPSAKPAGKAFVMNDRQADQATSGPLWLKDPRVAKMVRDTLWRGEQERLFYELQAWVIMPNHVHVLWQPTAPLSKILRWLKGSTAYKANKILGRTGHAFWQDESFDHWIRSDNELHRTVRYIEWNPVTAGFVGNPAEWQWSSAGTAGGSACPTLQQVAEIAGGSACPTVPK